MAADRIDEVIRIQSSIRKHAEPEKYKRTSEGVICFDHVNFRYPGSRRQVIHGH
ncbi:MAG: hypothetical protein ACLVCH_11720 [Roseburia inulinivorans]